MQIVIEIDKQMYENAKNDLLCGAEIIVNAIKNGIPLSAECGNLVDINDVATALIYSGICDTARCGKVKEVLSKIPIIIEGSAE